MLLISMCTVAVFLVMVFGIPLKQYVTTENSVGSLENKYVVNKFVYVLFFATLVIVSTSRFGFVDTFAYKGMYVSSRNDLAYVNSGPWGVEAGWLYLCYYLNYISPNSKTILLFSAIIIIGAYTHLIKKYSVDPLFSLLLFYFLEFLATNNGIRQMVAAGIIMLAIPLLNKRKIGAYILFFAVVYLAMQLHNSAEIWFILFFVIIGKPLNPIMKMALIFGIVFMFIPSYFNDIIGDMFEDSKYVGYLEKSNGMSFMRALIMGVIPGAFSIGYLTKVKHNNAFIDREEGLLINLTLVNTVLILMGITMQYWARFAFYTSFAPMIMMPKYINGIFNDKTRKLVRIIAIILYFTFFCYNIYVNNDYGNMDEFYWSWDK